jgi:hypothetical protein
MDGTCNYEGIQCNYTFFFGIAGWLAGVHAGEEEVVYM